MLSFLITLNIVLTIFSKKNSTKRHFNRIYWCHNKRFLVCIYYKIQITHWEISSPLVPDFPQGTSKRMCVKIYHILPFLLDDIQTWSYVFCKTLKLYKVRISQDVNKKVRSFDILFSAKRNCPNLLYIHIPSG